MGIKLMSKAGSWRHVANSRQAHPKTSIVHSIKLKQNMTANRRHQFDELDDEAIKHAMLEGEELT